LFTGAVPVAVEEVVVVPRSQSKNSLPVKTEKSSYGEEDGDEDASRSVRIVLRLAMYGEMVYLPNDMSTTNSDGDDIEMFVSSRGL